MDNEQLEEPLLEAAEEPTITTATSHEASINEASNAANRVMNSSRIGSSPVQRQQQNEEKDISFPPWCSPLGRSCKINHNVFFNLLLAFLSGLSDSLWAGTVIAAYLKFLGHNENQPVGNIEAVNGMAALLSALPVGYLADRYGRARVIRAGGIVMLLTAVLHISLISWIGTDPAAIVADDKKILWGMGAVMALWGITGGVVNGPAQALYADSTPLGKRSEYYQYLFGTYMVASAVGPAVAIVLFETVGDEWDLRHLRNVLYAGLGIASVEAIVMLFLDDTKALDEGAFAEESSFPQPEDTETANIALLDSPEAIMEQAPISPLASTADPSEPDETERPEHYTGMRRFIPYILFVHSLIMAIGSGMTVKFFPLFFKDDVGMSPSEVQFIYVLVPLFMTAACIICTKIAAAGLGRIQTSIVFQMTGISLLFSMVFFRHYLDVHPVALVPVYVARTALMNSVYPVQESVLMDFVPKQQRARWKSLEAVASFGWCGSAAFGGWLADEYDYSATFAITAVVQGIGVMVLALLLPLVPRREGQLPDAQVESERRVPTSVEEVEGIEQPLLEEDSNTDADGARR